MLCRCDFCCSCPHQTYLQICHNKGISRRLLNIHSLPATLSPGKRWKEMSLLDEYRNSQGHSGTQQQHSAKQPLPMPAKPRSRWGFRWPWIEYIVQIAWPAARRRLRLNVNYVKATTEYVTMTRTELISTPASWTQCVFSNILFFISYRHFNQLDALSKVMYRHEIICTGNTV